MISNFIYFWIPPHMGTNQPWRETSNMYQSKEFIRVEHWNEPYTFTYQKANHV